MKAKQILSKQTSFLILLRIPLFRLHELILSSPFGGVVVLPAVVLGAEWDVACPAPFGCLCIVYSASGGTSVQSGGALRAALQHTAVETRPAVPQLPDLVCGIVTGIDNILSSGDL